MFISPNEIIQESKIKVDQIRHLFEEIKNKIELINSPKIDINCERIISGIQRLKRSVEAIYQMGTALRWFIRREKIAVLNAISELGAKLQNCSNRSLTQKLYDVFSDSVNYSVEDIIRSFTEKYVDFFYLWPSVDIVSQVYIDFTYKRSEILNYTKGSYIISYFPLMKSVMFVKRMVGFLSIFLIISIWIFPSFYKKAI
jgi:hypothetical protein